MSPFSSIHLRMTHFPALCSSDVSIAASSPRTPDLNNTYGALFIGLLIAAVFVQPFTDVNLGAWFYASLVN